MSRQAWIDIATKALLAGVFFYIFQFYVLKASATSSVLWAAVMAIAAGGLSWSQWKRGG